MAGHDLDGPEAQETHANENLWPKMLKLIDHITAAYYVKHVFWGWWFMKKDHSKFKSPVDKV